MESKDQIAEHRIGELLVAAEMITAEDLGAALKLQEASNERLVNILMTQGVLNSEEFLAFLAGPDRYETIDLEELEIDAEVISLIPNGIARSHEVVPVERTDSTLRLAMVCPLDVETIEMLEQETGLKVHPFICSSLDLHECLDRYYSDSDGATSLTNLGGTLKLTTAVTMLRHIESLPALPGTVQKVREMLLSDTGTSADLSAVISRDPAIAAKMLKVANSAAYGFVQQVDSVELAVSLLGLLETYSVVVTSAVVDMFSHSKDFNYADFWMESMVCAKLAKEIAKIAQVSDTGVVMAGLLHDIGRIALVQLIPQHYAKVDQSLVGTDLVSAEEKVLGLTHTEAGYQLARHWDFPDSLAESIRFHHMTEYASEPHIKLVSIIDIADTVSRANRSGSETRVPDLAPCSHSLRLLGITAEDIAQLLDIMPESDSDSSFL